MRNEESIFQEALLQPSPHARQAFITQACNGNELLRREIEALLRAHERAADFLEAPPAGLSSVNLDLPAHADEQAGSIVGNYKLLEEIGEGGMGVVFMAEQLRPVQRRVAFKIIKPGLDTRQVIARFEAERQALALMEHPNIARVFDAGTTAAGRPYFVMELVRGIPITDYCDQNTLTPRKRLELFVQVCQAVQHAHQKGIIHRDLKPSNVLVTLADDGSPVPKVIDFGISKAIGGQRLTERTMFTEFRQLIGTPLYMSPEQAEMNALQDVDTRSDVYSLGVLLYELLTGTTPFAKERLAQAACDEVRRIIREEEPPRPSTRLSTLGKTLTSVSAQRRTDPRKLSQTVRGELDWIVMKALEKDRGRRYDTASGLAQDLERYLSDQPVQACPPTRVYRFKKTVRRNKAAITTASAIIVVLIAAAAVSTWQAVRATRAKTAADRAIKTSGQIAGSLQQMLASADPSAAKGADYTVDQMLDNLAASLDRAPVDQPEAEAALRSTLGLTYYRLGHAGKASEHLARAVELRRRLYGERHEKFADALVDYASCLKEQGWYLQWDKKSGAEAFFSPAEADARKALDIYRLRGVGGQRVLSALYVLQAVLQSEGRLAESQAVGREGLAVAAQTTGVEFLETAIIYSKLADAKLGESNLQETETLTGKSMAILQRLGGHPSDLGWDFSRLGQIRAAQHRYAEAIAAIDQSLEVFRRVYPPRHWAIVGRLGGISDCLRKARDRSALAHTFPHTEQLFAVEEFFWQFLPTEPSSMDGLIELVGIYDDLAREFAAGGNKSDANAAHQKAAQLFERLREKFAGNPATLARLLEWRRDIPGAIAAYSQAIKGEPDRAALWASRANCYSQTGDPARSRDDYTTAVRLDPRNPRYWTELGDLEYERGDHKQAILDRSKAIALGDNDNNTRRRRGWSYEALEQFQEALQDYSRAIEINPRQWRNWFAHARLCCRMRAYDTARKDVANALRNSPDLAVNELAWELATSPEPALRDDRMAVVIAERAVKLQPLDQQAWNTLGVARYRCGDYSGALDALEKSRDFHIEKFFAWDAFFLAMANWQFGNRDDAREWYEQAVACMDDNQPHNQELLRFRAEANALIFRKPPTASAAPGVRTPSTSRH